MVFLVQRVPQWNLLPPWKVANTKGNTTHPLRRREGDQRGVAQKAAINSVKSPRDTYNSHLVSREIGNLKPTHGRFRRYSGTTPTVAISGAVTPNVSFRAFDTDTKKWVLLAALSGCIICASFPLSRYPEQFFLRGIQKGERP